MHRWVGGSVAQWVEPSIHKQLLISTNRVEIKKKAKKEKIGIGEKVKKNRNIDESRSKKKREQNCCNPEEGVDFQVLKKGQRGERKERGDQNETENDKKGRHQIHFF